MSCPMQETSQEKGGGCGGQVCHMLPVSPGDPSPGPEYNVSPSRPQSGKPQAETFRYGIFNLIFWESGRCEACSDAFDSHEHLKGGC